MLHLQLAPNIPNNTLSPASGRERNTAGTTEMRIERSAWPREIALPLA